MSASVTSSDGAKCKTNKRAKQTLKYEAFSCLDTLGIWWWKRVRGERMKEKKKLTKTGGTLKGAHISTRSRKSTRDLVTFLPHPGEETRRRMSRWCSTGFWLRAQILARNGKGQKLVQPFNYSTKAGTIGEILLSNRQRLGHFFKRLGNFLRPLGHFFKRLGNPLIQRLGRLLYSDLIASYTETCCLL